MHELDSVIGQAMKAGHPDMPILAERMQAAPDPIAVAMEWRQQVGGQQQQGGGGHQQQRRAPVMPSNLAGARNVGRRFGPAWAGPPSMDEIFGEKRSIFKTGR